MSVFDVLGLVVAAYTAYAAVTGKVIAKRGPWARIVARDVSPGYFWAVIVIYGGLSIALVTVF